MWREQSSIATPGTASEDREETNEPRLVREKVGFGVVAKKS